VQLDEGAGQPGPADDPVSAFAKRVGELEQLLGIVQPTLSQQLTVLREEQLVNTRREGKSIYYSVKSPQALAVIQTLYQQFCSAPCQQAN
jgi:DNA-binding transcriptional ArsR family regulator